MIIYNLTDRTPPWEKAARTAQSVKLFGKLIPAGGREEFPNFPLRTVTGLISSHTVSVDSLPDWYQKAGDALRQKEREKLLKTRVDQAEEDEKPKRRSRRESR
jgi:hypothetical protein